MRIVWGLFALGLTLAVLAVGLQGIQRTVALEIAPGDMEWMAGHAFKVDLKHRFDWPWRSLSDNLHNPHRSDLVLMEGGEPVGLPHAAYDRVRETGLGSYLHWGKWLIFSSTDNADPRTNGRSYSLRVSVGISHRILAQTTRLGGLFMVAALGFLAWVRRDPLVHALGEGLRHLRERAGDYAIAALAPTACALLAGLLVPPLWNGSDSAIWILWQLTWIPHHPPIYPVFMALMAGLWDQTPQLLHAVMTVQHAAFILAITYAASCYRERWRIALVSILICVGSTFNAYAHGLYTEGLATPFLIVFLGALLRLWRDGLTRPVALALGLGLLAASLTRHALLVFAALPVAYLGLWAILSRWPKGSFKQILQAVALMASVWVANSLVTQSICLLLDAQTTSILGRAGVYRIQEAYRLVPPTDAPAWLDALSVRADDPAVRQAIPIMAQTPNPWTGPRDRLLETPTLSGLHPDVLMNAGFKAFAFWLDPYVLAQWRFELTKALLGPGSTSFCPGQMTCLLQGSVESVLVVFPADPRTLAVLAGTGAERPETATVYRHLMTLPVTGLMDALLPLAPEQRAVFLGLSLLLALISLVHQRRADFTALVATLWGGILLYALSLTVVTVVLPRYLAPIDFLVWLSNAVCLIGFLEPRKRIELQQRAGHADTRLR